MTSLLNILLLLVLPGQLPPSPQEQHFNLDTYCNERFQFCSQFPAETFTSRTDYFSGNGLLLRTENDLAKVTIAGHYGYSDKTTKEIHALEIEKLTQGGEQSVLISSLFGEDFYECFFLVGKRSFYQKNYLFKDYIVRLSIETTINHPKLMQELRDNVTLYFPEERKAIEGSTSMTGRE